MYQYTKETRSKLMCHYTKAGQLQLAYYLIIVSYNSLTYHPQYRSMIRYNHIGGTQQAPARAPLFFILHVL